MARRLNILEQDALLINRALCDRFKIVNGSGKTPSFFTQYGAAITPAVKPEMLAKLLQSTMETEDDPTWSQFEAEEIEEAKAKVEESFANITLDSEAEENIGELEMVLNKPTTLVLEKTPNRNDPCSCGSGKKYKKCCG